MKSTQILSAYLSPEVNLLPGNAIATPRASKCCHKLRECAWARDIQAIFCVILLKGGPLSFRSNTGIARVQARVAEKKKKNTGLAVLLGVSREPRPRPIRGWVADLFCV